MSESSCMKIIEEHPVLTIEFRDQHLLDAQRIREIQDKLTAIIEQNGKPLILLDFHNVQGVSSSLLGVLLAAQKKIKAKDGRMRLVSVRPTLMRLFTLTKMDKVLMFANTRTEARSMLNGIARSAGLQER